MEHARPPAKLALEGGPATRSESWRQWHKLFEVFLKASGVSKEPKEVQASLLVNLIGSAGYEVYSTFTFDATESEDDINCVLKKFDMYFGTKQNITVRRYKFFTRNQEDRETIDQYVIALRLLIKQCEFGDLHESLLRDKIVCGIRNNTVRDRLLRTDELTLSKAIEICQAAEISKVEIICIDGGSEEVQVSAISGRVAGGERGRHWSGSRGVRRGTSAGGGAGSSRELRGGSWELRGGTRELRGGTRELRGGTRELRGGTRELRGGSRELRGGSRELRGGSRALRGGSRELRGGLRELRGGSRELRGGSRDLHGGSWEPRGGSREVRGGTGPCSRCGGARCSGGDQCPAREAQCFVCDKKGHFSRVCERKKVMRKVLHLSVDSTESDGEEMFYVNTIAEDKK